MPMAFIRRFLISFLLLSAIAFVSADSYGEPPLPPTIFTDRRVFGLKYDESGFIDPTPDVIPLNFLPRDGYGFIDWAKALSEGIITPRDSIKDKEEDHTVPFSEDIIIKAKMDFMPDVLFPHSTHNFWLSCNICHPKIFEAKAGATPISMVGIWKGEFCGRCHDRVAFPLRSCFRCHSVKREAR